MILWNHHDKLSDDIVVKIKNIAQNNFQENQILYTTYESTTPHELLSDYYALIQEKMMKDLYLFHRTKYYWSLWVQMYNDKTNGHPEHDHFGGNNIISWVHFIQTSNQKCFYFVGLDGNKIYPNHQSSGDIIAFPSWSLHGVDKVTENNFDRIIVAGNIKLSYIEQPNEVAHESNCFHNTTLWITNYV
jgi:hypothetical protein